MWLLAVWLGREVSVSCFLDSIAEISRLLALYFVIKTAE